MKKLILFAIFAILITPNAHAATGDCPNGYEWCSLMAWGDNGCCIPNGQICDQDSCNGGTITPVVVCEGLPCENFRFWSAASDGTNRETMCNVTDDECDYRCPEGYYPSDYTAGTSISGSIKELNECRTCPTGTLGATVATCPGGTSLPICIENKYRVWHNTGGSLLHYVGYATCDNCPYYVTSNNTAMPGSAPEGSASVTSCYIPEGTTMSDDTGTYTISGGDCKYNNAISGGGLPVTPVG